MKIRSGFVSNSSSSSFICEVCGEEQSGMDLCLSDCDMYECVNGHTFCESHALEFNQAELTIKEKRAFLIDKKSWSKEEQARVKAMTDDAIFDEYADYMDDEDERYECNPKLCPICQLKTITDEMLVGLIMAERGVKRTSLEEEFRQYFGNYEKYKESTNQKS